MRRLLLAALFAVSLAVAPAWPASASQLPLEPGVPADLGNGEPIVSESDFRGAPAGEERPVAVAVRYAQPRWRSATPARRTSRCTSARCAWPRATT